MSYGGSDHSGGWNQGGGPDYRHAFDPYSEPELFRSVLTRRVIAFIIDLFILAVPIALAVIFIAVFGLVTLGLGWALFWLVSPASIVWALIYYGVLPRRTAFGDHRHADDGPGNAHLVRRALLFPARRHPSGAVLDFDQHILASRAADRTVQHPPAAVARLRAGNRRYQQLGSCPGSAIGADHLNRSGNQLTVKRTEAMLGVCFALEADELP